MDYVFNHEADPLFTQGVNTYKIPFVTGMQEENASKAGVLYSLFTTSATLSIPSGASNTLHLSNILIGATGNGTVTFTKNPTSVTGGGNVTAFNLNFGSSFSDISAFGKSNPTVSGGSTLFTLSVAAGNTSFQFNGSLILPPNTTLVITGSSTSSITAIFWQT